MAATVVTVKVPEPVEGFVEGGVFGSVSEFWVILITNVVFDYEFIPICTTRTLMCIHCA